MLDTRRAFAKRPPGRRPAQRRGPTVEPLEGRRLLAAINEFGAAAGVNQPADIVAGPDGAMWFGQATGQVGRIGTDGVVTLFSAGITPGSNITSIAAGSDGALWFTESNRDAIGRITTSGVVTEYDISEGSSLPKTPLRITPGSDGALWFTETDRGAIGRISTDGVYTQYVLPGNGPSPTGIVSGPDGNLWYLESLGNAVGVISTSGVVLNQYTDGITSEAGLTSITNGPNGTLWFTEAAAGQIGRITTQGVVTEYATGAPNSRPYGIAYGPDGNFYYTESQGDAIGQITTGGAVFRTPVPTTGDLPYGIAVGPDLNVWFTEYGGTQIGQVVLPTSIIATGQTLTVTAGVASDETYAVFTDLSSATVAGNFQATVDFGDGTSGIGVIQQVAPGQFAVRANHTYATAATFTATVKIGTTLGNAAPVLTTVTAVEAPSRITATGTTIAAVAGVPVTAAFATFADTNTRLPAGAYLAFLDFGDGTTGAGVVTQTGPGRFTVTATHAYADPGDFAATVRVSRDEIYDATATSAVAVAINPDLLDTVVVNTNDSGRGSLRQAILNSNVLPGANRITFAIPGAGVRTIRPLTPLPDLTDTATIDGTTQAAFAGVVSPTPLIEVDGGLIGQATSGLRLAAGAPFSNVTDLSVYGFRGPQVDVGSGFSTVLGNHLGLRADGTVPGSGLSDLGLRITGASARVGGTAAGQRNVIGGNAGQGVEVFGSFSILLGNLIGLDPTGTLARGNGGHGVLIQPGSSFIYVSQGNVISANGGNGVEILGATDCSILGAKIGTDVTGTRALGNAGAGVCFDGGAARNGIGINAFDTTTSPPVLISGNGVAGVVIREGSSGNNVVGSMIGTDVTGTRALGNGSTGLLISDAPGNLVAANLISGNGAGRDGAGVWIEGSASSGNVIRGNFIGTDFSGTARLGNAVVGVLIVDAPGNVVGGTDNGGGGPARNVVSGNGQVGVMISGIGATGNRVEGNLVGTDVTGTAAVPNGAGAVGTGVYVNGAPGNTIGGSASGAGNVISGNRADGILLFAPQSTGNLVQGNFIGTDATGTRPLGNRRDGVAILNAPRNQVSGNTIAANGRNGVAIGGRLAVGTVVSGNTIGGFAPDRRALANGDWGVLVTQNAPGNRTVVAPSNRIGTNGRGRVQADSGGPTLGVIRVRGRAASFGGRALAKLAAAGKPRRPA